MELKRGDVVRLAADSWRMNVRMVQDGEVLCEWRDKQGKHHMVVYPASMLLKMGWDAEGEKTG